MIQRRLEIFINYLSISKIVHVAKPYPYKVEVPVEKIVHVPYEKIVEKFIKVPVDR